MVNQRQVYTGDAAKLAATHTDMTWVPCVMPGGPDQASICDEVMGVRVKERPHWHLICFSIFSLVIAIIIKHSVGTTSHIVKSSSPECVEVNMSSFGSDNCTMK